MNIGRTVKVFTAEPLVSPVPADERPADTTSDPAPAAGPVAEPVAAPPTRTTATAAR